MKFEPCNHHLKLKENLSLKPSLGSHLNPLAYLYILGVSLELEGVPTFQDRGTDTPLEGTLESNRAGPQLQASNKVDSCPQISRRTRGYTGTQVPFPALSFTKMSQLSFVS